MLHGTTARVTTRTLASSVFAAIPGLGYGANAVKFTAAGAKGLKGAMAAVKSAKIVKNADKASGIYRTARAFDIAQNFAASGVAIYSGSLSIAVNPNSSAGYIEIATGAFGIGTKATLSAARAAKVGRAPAAADVDLPIVDNGPNFLRNGGCFTEDTLVMATASEDAASECQASPNSLACLQAVSIKSVGLGTRVIG